MLALDDQFAVDQGGADRQALEAPPTTRLPNFVVQSRPLRVSSFTRPASIRACRR